MISKTGLTGSAVEIYGRQFSIRNYLWTVSERYNSLKDIFQCIQLNLINEAEKQPAAQLVTANLLIEYIGYEAFQKVILQIKPEYVCCVIQINTDEKAWVSESPYLHAFDSLDSIHHQMDEAALIQVMKEIGYSKIVQISKPLLNGKALVRVDFIRQM